LEVRTIEIISMKALSIQQPWLYAITDLDKRVENRTWKPPWWIIGRRIALHASKIDDRAGYVIIRDIANVDVPPDLPRGCIVATAKVLGWIDESNDKWFFGPYGWILDDINKISPGPVFCRGALGLWDVTPEYLV
jgi:hypothetical protein